MAIEEVNNQEEEEENDFFDYAGDVLAAPFRLTTTLVSLVLLKLWLVEL